jgi:Myosin N-terminal SH3-like domain/Domain of unknown function (DUF5666)
MTDPNTPVPSSYVPPTAPTETAEAPVVAKKAGTARWLVPTLALGAAILVGLFGGVVIGQSTASASSTGQNAGGFPGGAGGYGAPGDAAGGLAAGGGFTSGTIVSISGDSMVIKTTDGSEVTVKTSDATTVTETSTTTLSELKAGQTVTAIGAADSDGNVTATSIAEGETRGGFGGARPGATTAP